MVAAAQRSAASQPLAAPSCRAVLTVDGSRWQCGGSTCGCLCRLRRCRDERRSCRPRRCRAVWFVSYLTPHTTRLATHQAMMGRPERDRAAPAN
eukprot:351776-Chlamydomonas_euryale.AAC.7